MTINSFPFVKTFLLFSLFFQNPIPCKLFAQKKHSYTNEVENKIKQVEKNLAPWVVDQNNLKFTIVERMAKYNIQQLSLSPFFAIGHTKTIAFLVLSLEMIIAVLFLIPRAQNIAFLLSLCLLTSFTVYIHIIQYSEFIPCSCGGILGKLSWNDHIIFNIFFIIISFFGYYFNDSKIIS